MTTATNIATKLNILESAIVRVEEWVNVLFVVVKGLGGRFVSKKMKITEEIKVEHPNLEEKYSTKKHFSQQIDLAAQALSEIGEAASVHDKKTLEHAIFIRDNMLDNLYPVHKWGYGATSSVHNIMKTLKIYTSALECVLEDNGFNID